MCARVTVTQGNGVLLLADFERYFLDQLRDLPLSAAAVSLYSAGGAPAVSDVCPATRRIPHGATQDEARQANEAIARGLALVSEQVMRASERVCVRVCVNVRTVWGAD